MHRKFNLKLFLLKFTIIQCSASLFECIKFIYLSSIWTWLQNQNNNLGFSTLLCTSFSPIPHRVMQPQQLTSREILPRGQKLHLLSFRTTPPLGAAMHAQTQTDCRWFLARVFWHTSQRFNDFDFGCLSNKIKYFFLCWNSFKSG